MTRLRYRLYRLASALRYRVPRRFTPAGILALAALIVSGSIGMDMDQTVAFQAFAFAVCLLGVSLSSAVFFRGKFTARRVLPRFGSVGQSFTYPVHIRRLAGRAQKDLEWLEETADPRPKYPEYIRARRVRRKNRSFRLTFLSQPRPERRMAKVMVAPIPAFSARGEAETRVEIVPLQRGPLRFTGATVARPDPLGLVRGFVRMKLPETMLILPRRYPLPDITLPGTRSYQRGGVSLAAAVGESEEFVSLRDYRPGDPVRHIHWRSWARTGRPIVKEFQDEFFVRHALILDTFVHGSALEASVGEGSTSPAFEEAISVAASFACTVGTQESLLDLLFVGPKAVCFTTGRGLGQAEQALEVLASVQPCAEQSFDVLKELVLRHAETVCGCVCVFLSWDEPRRELVRQLRMRNLPMLVLIVAEPTEAIRLRGAVNEEGGEHVHILEVGKVAEGLQVLNFQ